MPLGEKSCDFQNAEWIVSISLIITYKRFFVLLLLLISFVLLLLINFFLLIFFINILFFFVCVCCTCFVCARLTYVPSEALSIFRSTK